MDYGSTIMLIEGEERLLDFRDIHGHTPSVRRVPVGGWRPAFTPIVVVGVLDGTELFPDHGCHVDYRDRDVRCCRYPCCRTAVLANCWCVDGGQWPGQ